MLRLQVRLWQVMDFWDKGNEMSGRPTATQTDTTPSLVNLLAGGRMRPQPQVPQPNFLAYLNNQQQQPMPDYQQLIQQNMLQGQQRIQNVPNVRGLFGGNE